LIKAHYPQVRARGHAAQIVADLAASLGADVTPVTADGARIAGGKKRARIAG
jgi:hypothetical protein